MRRQGTCLLLALLLPIVLQLRAAVAFGAHPAALKHVALHPVALPPIPPALDHRDDYMGYVSRNLPGATGYKQALLLALKDMYTDLATQRLPRVPYGNLTLHPLSFSIPEELVLRTPPSKTHTVVLPYWATQDAIHPLPASHEHDGETAYFKTMGQAYFSLTVKKVGWDCLRHLEILAAGSLPLFTDVADAPSGSLTSYPKRVLAALLGHPGVAIEGRKHHDTFKIEVDKAQVDPELYMVTVAALLSYTRNVLTTEAMARYVLGVMGFGGRAGAGGAGGAAPAGATGAGAAAAAPSPATLKVLYLTYPFDISHSHGDYMADTLLHGLKRLLGQRHVVDVEQRRTQYKTGADLELTAFLQRRNGLYGYGFTFSSKLYEAPGEVDRRDLARRLAAKEFDVVLFAQAHTNDILKLELYQDVCKHVPAGRVAAVWAGDTPPEAARTLGVAAGGCVGFQFSREI